METATYLAICHFNDGAKSIARVLDFLGIDPGYNCLKICKYLDQERLRHAQIKSSEKAKKRRKQIRNFKKGYSERQQEIEGEMYKPGGF